MRLEKSAVVSTIKGPFVPHHDASVCIVDLPNDAKKYLEKSFKETLADDIYDYGEDEVTSSHEDDWSYAEIHVANGKRYGFVRQFYVSFMVHDPR